MLSTFTFKTCCRKYSKIPNKKFYTLKYEFKMNKLKGKNTFTRNVECFPNSQCLSDKGIICDKNWDWENLQNILSSRTSSSEFFNKNKTWRWRLIVLGLRVHTIWLELNQGNGCVMLLWCTQEGTRHVALS